MTTILFVIIFILLISALALLVALVVILRKYKQLRHERTITFEHASATLAAILDNIPDIIFSKGKDTRYTYVNKAFLNFFDLSENEVLGKSDSELPGVKQETAERFNTSDKYVLSQQQKYLVEEPVELNDKVKPTFETSKNPIIVNGEAVGLIGIARDITRRKTIEAQRRQHQLYLSNIKNSLAKIMKSAQILAGDYKAAADIVAKEGYKVLGVSRVAVWRFFPEENVLKCLTVFEDENTPSPLLPDYDLEEQKKYKQLLYAEKVIAFGVGSATTLALSDYSKNLCALIEAPINVHDRLFGVVSVEQDFSRQYPKQRKWTVEEHSFASSLADIMVLAVTGHERNEAQESAESANRLKSEFVSKMSHELRTPLSSIIGFVELSLDSDMPQKTKEYMKKIITSTEWLMEIINDLLDISKIESGKVELESIPFDISKILSTCKAMFMPQIAEKELNFYLNEEPFLPDKLPLGDPKKLRQVLQNLLSNALKFTANGVITLSALIKDTSDDKLTMHFEVKDSGIGMTAEQTEKIFMPFIQADSSTTRKYGGTGLGLAIANNIVRLMGSQLIVESNIGEGSTFMFDLTFDTVDRSEYIEVIEGTQIQFEQRRPIFEGEVLLCEDNEMARQMILEHLLRVGLNVVVAENGKDGVDKILERTASENVQFDLILMDIHMPVMDGKEATKMICSHGIEVPIVAVTANILTEDLTLFEEEGFSGYLSKPFASKELWSCLIKYLTPIAWRDEYESQNAEANKALRRKLINNFLKDGGHKVQQIRDALDQEDYKLAHRLAHTLKSNSGQLGAKTLQIISADIEHKLRYSIALVTPDLLNELERELKATISILNTEKDSTPQAISSDISTAGVDDVIELLRTVEKLLIGRDAACLKYIDKLRGIPNSDALIEQIENFDFKIATGTLSELLFKLGEKEHG